MVDLDQITKEALAERLAEAEKLLLLIRDNVGEGVHTGLRKGVDGKGSAEASSVPHDVARLVIAARVVLFESSSPEAIRELDQASEAFADRVPWEDEPARNLLSETQP